MINVKKALKIRKTKIHFTIAAIDRKMRTFISYRIQKCSFVPGASLRAQHI